MPTLRTALISLTLSAALAACGNGSSTGPGGGGLPVIGDSAIGIGPINGTLTRANGVNDSGVVVGEFIDLTLTQYGWLERDGTIDYVSVPFAAIYTAPQAINDSAHMTGYYAISNTYHGFLYDGSTYSSFDYPAAIATQGYGINTSGKIVGVYFPSGSANGHAFLKVGSTFTNIDPPGVLAAAALGINTAGDVVGEYVDSNNNVHGYLWPHGAASPTELTYAGLTHIIPYGINDAGDIVGSCIYGGNTEGFLARNGTVEVIVYPGAQATEAYAINNSGAVVGQYATSSAVFGYQLATQ